MALPSFSIVIPTYQRREIVCIAIRALSRQSYNGAFELILVVDGSTDGTAEAVAHLECAFPLRVIEQPNRGAAAARNRGAAEAGGDIILFLDDDMVAAPDLLQQHAKLYSSGVDAVTGEMHLHADAKKGFLSKDFVMEANWEHELPATPFEIFTGQLSVRRTVFRALGGFDESYTAEGGYGNEDIDFGVKLVERYTVRHNRDALTHQLSSVGPSQTMRRARLIAKADAMFALKHPQLADELFARRGSNLPRVRRFYRRLSRFPLVASLLAFVAVAAAEMGLKTPLRSNRHLARLFFIAYTTSYWSGVNRSLKPLRPTRERQ